MKKTIGILAHVDAGKTTFSEQVLYHAGAIRNLGRVDHGDAFLDAHPMERQRGITIFSDQAHFTYGGDDYYWVDTPGHVDFSAEMERAIRMMDYAVLIVSCAEGVQSHTESVFQLLQAYRVPVFIFLNKIDRAGADPQRVLAQMRSLLSADVVDARSGFEQGKISGALIEQIAERDEVLLDRYLLGEFDQAAWLEGFIAEIAQRKIFPVFAGSALLNQGVAEFLASLHLLTRTAYTEQEALPFAAVVGKTRYDAQGKRLTFLKITAGRLRAREEIATPDGAEQIHEIRLYHGAKYATAAEVVAGDLCAVTGLTGARAGDTLGAECTRGAFVTRAVLASTVEYDPALPSSEVLSALKRLEDEDPTLGVEFSEQTRAIQVNVMGEIQLEVLRQLMADRYGMSVSFGPVRVCYQETIEDEVVGIGHYEPLRHYAEVHLRLSPGPRGSGITFASACHVDTLALNWQRLIETHVHEKRHRGVLTGAPLTDVQVTLLTGRAHLKHTEGGDFREATYRAIRNALMQAKSVLMEPVCRFELRAPAEAYGRIMTGLTRLQARLGDTQHMDEGFTLSGEAPYAEFIGFQRDFMALTHGRGALLAIPNHYEPCRNAEEIIQASGYNPLADDTPDSVFCAKGAGFNVAWDQVRAWAHCSVE